MYNEQKETGRAQETQESCGADESKTQKAVECKKVAEE